MKNKKTLTRILVILAIFALAITACTDGSKPSPKPKTCTHTWGNDVVTPPTCTVDGYTTQTCSKCSETQKINPTAAGHTWQWVETISATMSAELVETDGVETKTCSICNDTDGTRSVTFQSYFYGKWVHNSDSSLYREVSNDRFFLQSTGNDHLEINDLTWETISRPGNLREIDGVNDADLRNQYPVGYKLTGTVISHVGVTAFDNGYVIILLHNDRDKSIHMWNTTNLHFVTTYNFLNDE
jgi:hypothetical protein